MLMPVATQRVPPIPGLFVPPILIPPELASHIVNECMRLYFEDKEVNQIMLLASYIVRDCMHLYFKDEVNRMMLFGRTMIAIDGEEEVDARGGDAPKSKDAWMDMKDSYGFAFIDFRSIDHATTEALVDPRYNHLNRRDLVVEYASPGAVRWGGDGSRYPKGEQDQKSRGGSGKAPQKDSVKAPYGKQPNPRRHTKQGVKEDHDAGPAKISAETTTPRHGQSHTRCTKPGAALAHALQPPCLIRIKDRTGGEFVVGCSELVS